MSWKPHRTVLAVLFLAYLLCYLDRMVMASAIPFIAHDFRLSPLRMGEVLSAFFVGYAVMQAPGGLLADRFGSRLLLTGSIAWWSLMTVLSGASQELMGLLIVRVLFGLGEGPFPAATYKALSLWVPVKEVGRASGLLQAATSLGAALAPLVAVPLIVHWGWRAVFFVLLPPGLLVAVLVWRFVKDRPPNLASVDRDQEPPATTGATITLQQRFLQCLQTPAVLWCAATLFLSNIVSWGLMNWLPTYLLQARGFGIERMGIFTSLANFAGGVGYLLGGWVCDRYFAQRLWIPIVGGLFSSGVLTYMAAVAPSGESAVAELAGVFLLSNVSSTAIFTLPLLIVRADAVGSTFGIVNTAGQLAGVVAPMMIGYLLELSGGDFKVVLYTMVGLTLVAIYPALQIRQLPASKQLL